jgi:hypothetical protein
MAVQDHQDLLVVPDLLVVLVLQAVPDLLDPLV